ncbi:YhgE/Pip domain-containing protein [Pseudoclavibacter caeni]|uniref:YhgE/Pip domain-containing protein n=1 Tax=Pseudoclavibacter caeni TaxID=908846 RepID=A0A7C8FIM4_9MICO|nr:YhgE/Pip domain-containing protein [Pseudoclavibacter caeni]KAB1632332.1 YhgE/Pip domain-containing protein [Pseudoclavibacter caeni]NYJ97571.1 putative membrane protein [Pseudoclavibacter caeni]
MSVFSPGTELKRMTRGRLPKVALVVLLFIPLIYGALYLWAFWAPTDRMSDLPVALVNEDQAATASDGTEVSAGDDLVDTLLDRRDLDWHLTDADDAQDGMSNGGYYFAVTIPEDFSQRIASLDTDAQTAEIEVDYNDTNSFLADTLGKQAMKQVRDTLAETVSQEQADKVLVGVNKLSDGIRDAADAADEVNDGAQQLKDGNTQLADGATTLTAGLGDLADGTASLADGAGQVAQGAQTAQNGSQQLAAGAGQLSSGAAQASSGVAALQSGATAFASGMSTESQGLAQLNQKVNGEASTEASNMPVWQAAQELSDGASKVSSGVNTLSETLETQRKTLQDNPDLQKADEAITQARKQIHSTNPDFPVEPNKDMSGLSDQSDLISALVTIPDTEIPQANKISLLEAIEATGKANSAIATLQQADAGITTVQPGQTSSLKDGANGLAEGAAALQRATGSQATDPEACTAAVSSAENAGSTPKLTDTVCALSNGAATLNASFGTKTDTSSDTLLGGINQLASGTTQLAAGSDTLATNLNQLVAGLGTLSDGSSQVASGADQLNTGAESAESGSAQLADGAQQASDGATQLADGTQEFSDTVSDGAAEAPDYSDGQTQSMSETIANAVSLAETTHNAVQGFGEGFAPFFIALATFVGALITWLILRPLPSRPLAVGASGLRTVLNGFVPASVLGLGQVIIMLAVLVWGIGVRPTHPIAMALFVLLTTFAFLTFQQMLIIVFGSAPGRVVALVLLMFQLSSSGGTYPVETTPKFFWWIHPYMPASYVVDGLRPLIGGGVDGRFWVALVFMSGLFLISLLISAIAAQAQRVWTVGRLHPEITI